MTESCFIKISGIVQGVGFRYYTLRRAQQIGIEGYVANNDDGTVSVYAVAPDKVKLESFSELLKNGPPLSSVERIEIDWRPGPQKYKINGFDIK